jgi:hypothetical protein
MPSYSYIGNGNLQIRPCCKYWKTINYPHKWSPGDILFSKQKAIMGLFEKVAIKQVRLIMTAGTAGKMIFIYLDTFNSLWNENDLIQEYDALLLAKMYYEQKIIETTNANYPCIL